MAEPPSGPVHTPESAATAPGAAQWPQPYSGWGLPPPTARNELGTASLWFGISGGVFFWFPTIGLVLGITAVATGFGGLARVKRREATNRGAAITGLMLGIVTTIVGALILLGIGYLFFSYQNCIDHAQGRGEYAQC